MLYFLPWIRQVERMPCVAVVHKMRERFKRLKNDFCELNVFEKIFDILTIAIMVTVTVIQIVTKDDFIKTIQLEMNIAASAALFLTHILFKEKYLLGGLSLKNQKYINVIVLIGSFGGQYFILGNYYSNYDTATHLVAGSIVCFIGYGIYEFQAKEKSFVKPSLSSMYSFLFSMFTAIFWEIFEFSADFITGGTCQGYDMTLDCDKFFYFRWFTAAAKPVNQSALYDTFADLFAALITSSITVLIMFFVLKKQKAKAEKEEVLLNA